MRPGGRYFVIRFPTLGESGWLEVGGANSKVGSDVADLVSGSEISGFSANNSLVAEETSINSEIEIVCGVCSAICGWSNSELGWIIINNSSCSINPVLLITFWYQRFKFF